MPDETRKSTSTLWTLYSKFVNEINTVTIATQSWFKFLMSIVYKHFHGTCCCLAELALVAAAGPLSTQDRILGGGASAAPHTSSLESSSLTVKPLLVAGLIKQDVWLGELYGLMMAL